MTPAQIRGIRVNLRFQLPIRAMAAHNKPLLIVLGVAAAITAAIAAIAVADPLTLAFLLAERRPALLRDAQWNDPGSARRFLKRFPAGTPEPDLTRWLDDKGFKTEAPGRATRIIGSLPCNELVRITWTRRPDGRIEDASAQISEAGCL